MLRRHELPSGGGRRCFVIGRQPGVADVLVTDDEAVSRQHAALVPRGDKLYVIDLKSLRGTFIDGVRIKPNDPVLLVEGATITLSDAPPYSFVVRGLAVAVTTASSIPSSSVAPAAPVLPAPPTELPRWQPPSWSVLPSSPVHIELFRGDQRLQSINIGGKKALILGRSAQQADITIPHESVSRQHAALVHAQDGKSSNTLLYIVDLGSAKGTFVESSPTTGWKRLLPNKPVALTSGSRVRLSDCSTLLIVPKPIAPPPTTNSGVEAPALSAEPPEAQAMEGPRFSSLLTTTILKTSHADDVAAARKASAMNLPFPEQAHLGNTEAHDNNLDEDAKSGDESDGDNAPALSNADFRAALLPFLAKSGPKHEEDDDDEYRPAKKQKKKPRKRRRAAGADSDSDEEIAPPISLDKTGEGHAPSGGLMLRKQSVKSGKKASGKSEYKIKF